VRVIAVVAAYNEERFIAGCIEQLAEQGVSVYLLDNDSTDRTVELAEPYLGRGLLTIERLPRAGVYAWRPILERKAQLASSLDADWLLHMDADEVRAAPPGSGTLAEALAEVDRLGYTAVNFQEFTFVPTREHPDHDHPRFRETMRWYYPFLRQHSDQLKAWKRQDEPVDLVSSGGHRVDFPGVHAYPTAFPMRHYLFLSVDHALQKYVDRRYDAGGMRDGWHVARAALRAEDIELQPEPELRVVGADGALYASDPRTRHPLFGRE